MKEIDTEFHFKGFGNCDSRCRLRIYSVKSADRFRPQLHEGDKVVILTQLEGENVRTSVTNASEIIANLVAAQVKLEPLRTVWIEHYNYPGHTETFDRVTYDYRVSTVRHQVAHSTEVVMRYFSARWNHQRRHRRSPDRVAVSRHGQRGHDLSRTDPDDLPDLTVSIQRKHHRQRGNRTSRHDRESLVLAVDLTV